jgi:transcriptional regulator with XRE-family HTH domain
MNINFEAFGKKVKAIRLNLKHTQEDVKRYTGISNETMRRIENGIQEPKVSTLEKLGHLYKYDLVDLLCKSRSPLSFLSDEMIASINKNLRDLDYDGLKSTIEKMIHHVLNQYDDLMDEHKKKYLQSYLKAFENINFNQSKDLEKNIINVENFLLYLSNNKQKIGSDPYLYSLEVSSILFLMTQYRQKGHYDKALRLGKDTLEKLNQLPTFTMRQLNHMGSLYLNLSYTYHHLKDYEKSLHYIDAAFRDKKLVFSNHLYTELLFRKTIALYHLKDQRYKAMATALIMNCDETRKHMYCGVFKNNYNIDPEACLVCEKTTE